MLPWLVIGGATLLSGYMQSKAASKAAKAQTEANTAATAESARQFDAQMAQYRAEQDAALQRYYATQSALSPYTQTGTSALLQQRNLLGLDPDREAMIKQANDEYDRAVAAAKASMTPATTSSITEASTPGIGSIVSRLTEQKGKPSNNIDISELTNAGFNISTGEWKDKASMDSYVNELANSGYDIFTGKWKDQASMDAYMSENAASAVPIGAGIEDDPRYGAAVTEAEAARQKAIDYANSLPSGSEAQKSAIAAIEQGSEFTELAKQGEQGILSNASATGGLRGGNTQGALAQFRPSLLNSLINQQYERLGSLSGMGMSSILGGAGYSGASTAYPSGQNTIDLILNQGSINAGNALAQGNAWSSIPNAFASGLGMYGAMGGFSSTQNRGTTNSGTSGLTMPYHTAF